MNSDEKYPLWCWRDPLGWCWGPYEKRDQCVAEHQDRPGKLLRCRRLRFSEVINPDEIADLINEDTSIVADAHETAWGQWEEPMATPLFETKTLDSILDTLFQLNAFVCEDAE